MPCIIDQLGVTFRLGSQRPPGWQLHQSLAVQLLPDGREIHFLEWPAKVNSHGLSGSVRATQPLGGQYGCLGCQKVQYDFWHSSLGCSSLCSLRMVILPLGWQSSGPWPVAAACFQRIRATLLPVLLSFCAAVSVKQYDTYDYHPSQPCCAGSELRAPAKGAARGKVRFVEGEPALQLYAA